MVTLLARVGIGGTVFLKNSYSLHVVYRYSWWKPRWRHSWSCLVEVMAEVRCVLWQKEWVDERVKEQSHQAKILPEAKVRGTGLITCDPGTNWREFKVCNRLLKWRIFKRIFSSDFAERINHLFRMTQSVRQSQLVSIPLDLRISSLATINGVYREFTVALEWRSHQAVRSEGPRLYSKLAWDSDIS